MLMKPLALFTAGALAILVAVCAAIATHWSPGEQARIADQFRRGPSVEIVSSKGTVTLSRK